MKMIVKFNTECKTKKCSTKHTDSKSDSMDMEREQLEQISWITYCTMI